jgi:hypothetical protein
VGRPPAAESLSFRFAPLRDREGTRALPYELVVGVGRQVLDAGYTTPSASIVSSGLSATASGSFTA